MPAREAFTGFYSKALRNTLPCLSGQELKVFMALSCFVGTEGTGYPGVRALADVTTYPTTAVSHLLNDLEAKGVVVCLRKNGRDPITHQLVPDVYAVNPDLVVVSDPSLWNENRFRNASMPESLLTEEFTQADRITEAESEKQNQRSRITGPEGAATLGNTNPLDMATRSLVTKGENGGASSATGGQRQPNSTAQPRTSPGSAAPPPTRELTFTESVAVNAIRRQVPDMAHEKAAELVARYGIDQFTAAVHSMQDRAKKVQIKRPTGWIIKNLEQGARR